MRTSTVASDAIAARAMVSCFWRKLQCPLHGQSQFAEQGLQTRCPLTSLSWELAVKTTRLQRPQIRIDHSAAWHVLGGAHVHYLSAALQISACGELARLGLIAGSPEPGAATGLYDWDLATAALAASHAVKRQLDATLAQRRNSQQPPVQQPGMLPCWGPHQHAYSVLHHSFAG